MGVQKIKNQIFQNIKELLKMKMNGTMLEIGIMKTMLKHMAQKTVK